MEKWKLNALFQESELAKFLEMKIERYVGEMFWLENVGKLQIDENQNLDEITMTGEFGEEIDIVKEWIKEWKTMNTMDTEEKPILYNNELFNNKGDK